jgi:hypothetical protein
MVWDEQILFLSEDTLFLSEGFCGDERWGL